MYYKTINGQIAFKITKTPRGIIIDNYDNGQLVDTYEYDKDGKAIDGMGMTDIEQLDENYIENFFDTQVPYFEAENVEIQSKNRNEKNLLDSAIEATEETTRTSTINEQVYTIKTVQRDKQSTRQQEEYKENPETRTRTNGNPESFRDTLKFDISPEIQQEILDKHQEIERDFAEGKMNKAEQRKAEDIENGVR